MRTLVQTFTRELSYFVCPSERVYVLAYSYREFLAWRHERPGMNLGYIDNVDRLRGMQFPIITRTGRWQDRPDLRHIERRLFEIGASEAEFPAGTYRPYPQWEQWYYSQIGRSSG